ncbi:MAG TPA: hypothetical protein VK815_13090 [Candidatus Acidoferrales bacterium]|nr:hypothetical protein [Candidatus Acidoferrales bacterium]
MHRKLLLVVPLLGLLCGCAHIPKPLAPAAVPGDVGKVQLRNNAASLLHDLLGDEKDVSKVFVIKNGNQELIQFIKLISNTAAEDEKQLEQLAQTDALLNLNALNLPPGETAARDAVAKSVERDLLFSAGANFEFNLLLTQTQALSYGWHLAKVAGENSTQPQEVERFKIISKALEVLYNEAVRQMRTTPAK